MQGKDKNYNNNMDAEEEANNDDFDNADSGIEPEEDEVYFKYISYKFS